MSERANHSALETSAIRVPGQSPSLSVILLSQGTPDELNRALAAIGGRCRTLGAEVIVVRRAMAETLSTLSAAHPGVLFLDAPVESSCASMRELGVASAAGDILALRMDGAVSDGSWLQAFSSTVGAAPPAAAARPPREVARSIAPIADDAIAARERRTSSITRPLSVVAAEALGGRTRDEPGSTGASALAWPNARRVT